DKCCQQVAHSGDDVQVGKGKRLPRIMSVSALMTPQELPAFLGKRLNPIGTEMETERWMWYAFLQRPEFHINAGRTLLELVDRRFLAFYPSCNNDASWELYCTRSSKIIFWFVPVLQLAHTSVEVSPAREQFNRSRIVTCWIARIHNEVAEIPTI